jgi:hypothetical protein
VCIDETVQLDINKSSGILAGSQLPKRATAKGYEWIKELADVLLSSPAILSAAHLA